MTTRDRMVLIGIAVLAVLAGGWVLVVSPERKQAAEAQTQVQTARGQLETAQTQAASARAAQKRYAAAYSSVVSLGKAVPPAEEVPSLIYELERASNLRNIEFNSITAGSSGTQGSSGSSATTASTATSATPTGFTPMPFTFVFKGSFEGLAHLLAQVEGFAASTKAGGVTVNGRLLTIQGAEITPENSGAQPSSKGVTLTVTITATAYVLPATQGLTGGATALSPSAASAGSSASSGSAATPAVVRATP
jgi:Type II secretion system (T2SS), protein M